MSVPSHFGELNWKKLAQDSTLLLTVITLLVYIDVEAWQFELLFSSIACTALYLVENPKHPHTRPKNIIMGHSLSAVCGHLIQLCLAQFSLALAAGLAVGTSFLVMKLIRMEHPPAVETSLFYVLHPKPNFFIIYVPFILLITIFLAKALAKLSEMIQKD